MLSHVLGIDLGTTNSVVAYADDSRVRVLRDQDGRLLTPSVVAFPPAGAVKVGYAARELRLRDPHNTIFSIKRLMGRPWDSPGVSEAAGRLPFALERGPSGGVAVRVRSERLSLPEISSFILAQLRGLAERALGAPCKHAVITVPANFNELQRMGTRDAAHIAGLEVLRILNEPTAAALAYGYRARQAQRIAVYDFGGGTFDISILELSGDVIEVVSTAGDSSLGGDDVDRAIAERMAAQYAEQYAATLAPSPQSFARLTMAAERLKCQLSKQELADVTLKRLAGSDGQLRDFSFRLQQAELQQLADPLIERTFEICEEALRMASIRPTQLDAVLLVGGQTRTPRVRVKVGAFFGIEPQCSIDPDLAVAQGAALQGYALSGATASPRPDSTHLDMDALLRDMESLDHAASVGDAASAPGRAQAAGGFDDEPTVVSRRAVSGSEPQLPTLRPDRSGAGLTQTLAGVGAQLDGTSPSAAPAEARAAASGRIDPAALKTAPSRPGGGPVRRREPDADALRPPRLPRQDTLDDADADYDESDLPPVLRSSVPLLTHDATTATLLDSPRAKARAKQGSGSQGPNPQGISEARALAARGEVEAALALYGELLLRDPNDPLLLQEARELRLRREPVNPGRSAAELAELPDVSDAQRAVAPVISPGEAQFPAADGVRWTATLEEEVSALLSPLPAPLRSAAPEGASQLPAPRSRAPLLLDVTPHTLNVETVDGFCEPLIARNSPIPTEQTRIFTTSRDQQGAVSVRVSQGESRSTRDNHVLGQIELVQLRRAPRGEVRIAVTFVIDADGTLSARALDEGTGRSQELRVRLTGAIEPRDIERMRRAGRSRAS